MTTVLTASDLPPGEQPTRRLYTALLISSDVSHADRVLHALAKHDPDAWSVRAALTLAAGLGALRQGDVDVTILALNLPDCQADAAFPALIAEFPLMPVLILADRAHEELAWQMTLQGAQYHVLEEHLDANWLPRHVRRVIERKTSDDAQFEERERAQVTLDSIGDAVLSADLHGTVTYLNVVAELMTGWSRHDAIGRPVAEVFRIIDGTTREAARSPMTQAMDENRIVGLAANSILVNRDGTETAIEDSASPIHDRAGRVTGAVIVFHDVSASQTVARQMLHLAQHDYLTDLPNRLLLSDRIDYALGTALRHDRNGAVLFVDLDHFKRINDTLGHRAGDELLQIVAQRLRALVRASDTVGRLGGDEFVVLLDELEEPADAAIAAAKILSAIAAPCTLDGRQMVVTASIGISLYPGDASDPDALIRCADAAMYFAKGKGRHCACFYVDAMAARATA